MEIVAFIYRVLLWLAIKLFALKMCFALVVHLIIQPDFSFPLYVAQPKFSVTSSKNEFHSAFRESLTR